MFCFFGGSFSFKHLYLPPAPQGATCLTAAMNMMCLLFFCVVVGWLGGWDLQLGIFCCSSVCVLCGKHCAQVSAMPVCQECAVFLGAGVLLL